MNHRQRVAAVLRYQPYDRLPIVHFGFWEETLAKWAAEGHISTEAAAGWADGNAFDRAIGEGLGFDFNWANTSGADLDLRPPFARRVVAQLPDGGRHVVDEYGAVVLEKDDVRSIPAEIDHLLKDRASWEAHFKPRLQWDAARLDLRRATELTVQGDDGAPLALWCGSLLGRLRSYLGVVGLSYLMADDPALLTEMLTTIAELCCQGVHAALTSGVRFDYAHFWEDIAFKNGPLVSPRFFREQIAPGYRRITTVLREHGIDLISVDCDGKIDALVPIWLDNGVNTMFPIEVGTWGASIAPWRARYGCELRGVGGMDKRVFAADYATVDAEIERLKPLVDLGGYIPCPDHRIAPDARWENVQYYCERMRATF